MNSEPPTDIRAWHGTTVVRAQRIMTEGLRAGSGLAESPELARYYAEVTVDLEGGEPVVFEVAASAADLCYDRMAMEEPVLTGELRRDLAWHAAAGDHPDWMVDGYIRVPDTAWLVSWTGAGSVRLGGTIAPRRLRSTRALGL